MPSRDSVCLYTTPIIRQNILFFVDSENSGLIQYLKAFATQYQWDNTPRLMRRYVSLHVSCVQSFWALSVYHFPPKRALEVDVIFHFSDTMVFNDCFGLLFDSSNHVICKRCRKFTTRCLYIKLRTSKSSLEMKLLGRCWLGSGSLESANTKQTVSDLAFFDGRREKESHGPSIEIMKTKHPRWSFLPLKKLKWANVQDPEMPGIRCQTREGSGVGHLGSALLPGSRWNYFPHLIAWLPFNPKDL